MCFDRGNFVVVRDLSKYLRGGKISRHWKRSEFANPATDSSTDMTGKDIENSAKLVHFSSA